MHYTLHALKNYTSHEALAGVEPILIHEPHTGWFYAHCAFTPYFISQPLP